ncbi:MAG: hypothetical protein CXZ00_06110 [Acidobacteria bacterium]|nr:MAG: hypothetical protein CXZ00_06110 [Acidobacteriota bacterium]
MTDAEVPRASAEDPSEPEAGNEQSESSSENQPESEAPDETQVSALEMVDYKATIRRIEWMIPVAGTLCAVAAVWPLGWVLATGILLGTVFGWVNFHWLAESVNAIGERIVQIKSREKGAAIVWRGVGRIFLMALFTYAMFRYSVRGLVGFLAGLAMPVIAMMCEAVYEFVAANRRSS